MSGLFLWFPSWVDLRNYLIKSFVKEFDPMTLALLKTNCKKLLPISLQNILYKTLFATNFVGNTCNFYNFVGNHYPWRNYLPIKIFRKSGRKKVFSCNKTLFATNFVGNTCKFYNFVGNHYPRRNYLPIKIFRKSGRKKVFSCKFF